MCRVLLPTCHAHHIRTWRWRGFRAGPSPRAPDPGSGTRALAPFAPPSAKSDGPTHLAETALASRRDAPARKKKKKKRPRMRARAQRACAPLPQLASLPSSR